MTGWTCVEPVKVAPGEFEVVIEDFLEEGEPYIGGEEMVSRAKNRGIRTGLRHAEAMLREQEKFLLTKEIRFNISRGLAGSSWLPRRVLSLLEWRALEPGLPLARRQFPFQLPARQLPQVSKKAIGSLESRLRKSPVS